MDGERARELAGEYVGKEGREVEQQVRRRDTEHMGASMAALMPDLDVAAVFTATNPATNDEFLTLLGIKDHDLWRLNVTRDNPDEIPALVVTRYTDERWRVTCVGDAVQWDGGARVVLRSWLLRLDGEAFSFSTEHHVLMTPNRDSIERLGRALAAKKGWTVGDLDIRDH